MGTLSFSFGENSWNCALERIPDDSEPASDSCDDDGYVSKLSSTHPEHKLPRGKASTGSDTATSRPTPVTGSSSFSSQSDGRNGTEKAIPDNSEPGSVSCDGDDHASKLSSTHPEPKEPLFVFGVTLPNSKQLSAVAAVHVEIPSGKDSSVTYAICGGLNVKEVSCQLTKSGGCLYVSPQYMEETLEDSQEVGSFAALATVKGEPTSSFSVSSLSVFPTISQERGPTEPPAAAKLTVSVSSSPGGTVNMVHSSSRSHVFEFGVTQPNRSEPAPLGSPFPGTVSSEENVFTADVSSGPPKEKTASGNIALPGAALEANVELADMVTPQERIAGHKLTSDGEIHEASQNLPHSRLSREILKLRQYITEKKDMPTSNGVGFCPDNLYSETSALMSSPEAGLSTSTSRPLTITSGPSSVPATSTPMTTASTLANGMGPWSPTTQLTTSENGFATSSPVGHMKDTPRRPKKASCRSCASRGRAKQ
ncbi:uncharacterized protein LOC119385105 [Rhipicephalus sanguineus]|uniref:uncharacterized protein LOC119385105 n=1 Tax=Rhipicephalus sanguineus TaxID=34632 RepID=UPI0020C39388|nr:uncharacterized protein LOC119385105 [Rhipicephalus sanguineus]